MKFTIETIDGGRLRLSAEAQKGEPLFDGPDGLTHRWSTEGDTGGILTAVMNTAEGAFGYYRRAEEASR